MEAKKIYSPNQILLGAFWGGPLAATYFLRSNYLALGKNADAQKTLILGSAFVVALIVISPFLPEQFPAFPIVVMYSALAKYTAVSSQLGKSEISESDDYRFGSNWTIFGLGFLTMLAYLVLAMTIALGLEYAGLISLDDN
jgi:hypothetical protein